MSRFRNEYSASLRRAFKPASFGEAAPAVPHAAAIQSIANHRGAPVRIGMTCAVSAIRVRTPSSDTL